MERGQMGSAGSGKRSSPIKTWAPPFAMASVIVLLSSIPGSSYPEHPDLLNNVVHFFEFGFLGFLLARALHSAFFPGKAALFLLTVLICASFGLLDEAHQFMVPQRVFDLMDLIFDVLGAAAGTGAFILLPATMPGSSKSTASTGDRDA